MNRSDRMKAFLDKRDTVLSWQGQDAAENERQKTYHENWQQQLAPPRQLTPHEIEVNQLLQQQQQQMMAMQQQLQMQQQQLQQQQQQLQIQKQNEEQQAAAARAAGEAAAARERAEFGARNPEASAWNVRPGESIAWFGPSSNPDPNSRGGGKSNRRKNRKSKQPKLRSKKYKGKRSMKTRRHRK